MTPLTSERKKQVRLNLLVSAALFSIYTATYLLRMETTHFLAYLEAGGTILLVAAFLHRFDSVYFLGIAAFALVAQYGGVMFGLYDVFPIYDSVLHLASGVLLVLLGHYFLHLLTVPHLDTQIPRGVVLWFCWLFSVACAGLWEILEFGLDRMFGTNCQLWTAGLGGLMDTMIDIVMGAAGAIIGVPLLWMFLRREHGSPKDTEK